MAKLERYSGTRSLPGVRQAQVIADDAVGRAVQGLGSQIQNSAGQIGALAQRAEQRQQEVDGFEQKKRLLDFSSGVSQQELDASQNLAPGAAKYTETMLGKFDEQARAYVSSVPETMRARAELDVKSLRGQYLDRFAKTEYQERNRYFKEGIAETSDTLAKTIRADPGSYEATKATGRQFIEASGLPAIEKEATLKEWDRLASLAWAEALPAEERQKLFKPAPVEAASLLRAKEGFRERAYWDVNAWRTGYGSDTVTRADGTIEKVTKDTVVTREDAERDLARRTAEFEQSAAQSVGADIWAGLPPRARAALTSITYNYGSLPSSVANAARSGDLEAVAASVEGLKTHNGGINAKRRQEEADIIRGTASIPTGPAEYQERLAALTLQDQMKLADQADRDMVAIASTRQDSISLAIATDPLAVDRQQIIADRMMDDGQKAALIRSLDGALAATEKKRQSIDWFNSDGAANGLDPDTRKAAASVYQDTVNAGAEPDAVANAVVQRKGVLPAPFVNEIRNGMGSTNPQAVQLAYARASRLYDMSRDAVINAEHGDKLEDAAVKWRVYTESMGLSPEQAAQRIAEANSPEAVKARSALLESEPVKDYLKKTTDSQVEEFFDPGLLSIGPKLGANEQGRSIAVAEYKELFKEAVQETGGDLDAAEEVAKTRLARLWKASEFSPFGGGVVIKYPVEALYPADPGGSFEYVRDQAHEALKAEGIEPEEVYFTGDPEYTLKDFRAGRAPRMQLLYRDGNGVMQLYPETFSADIEAGIAAHKAAKAKDWADNSVTYLENARRAERRRALGDASRPSEMPGGSPLDAMNRAAEEVRMLEEGEN
jgi:GH24 family phage-related lysozyme (muramidase)